MNRSFVLIALFLSLATSVSGHGTTASRAQVALVEKLGQTLPQDLIFYDENTTKIDLAQYITKPTIIAPVYLTCTHDCPLLLTGLARVISKMDLVAPGRDYQVLALSFDEKDTPGTARAKKANYIAAIGKPFPEGSWKFLVSDRETIRKFTDAIGYTIQRDGENFTHPIGLVVVAPGGKIVRYLYGATFMPFDVTMAVNEAARGTVGSTAGRILTYCFSYDPTEKSYVFNVLKVTGTVVILFLGGFIVFLNVTGKRKEPKA